MEENEINLVVTALAPEPVHHRGKTGGDVRMAQILRRFGKKDGINILCVSTPYNRAYFEKNGIRTNFRIVESKSRFGSLAGLCFKSMLTILKTFFVLRADFLKGRGGKTIVYSSSDLFWEVFPAYYLKTGKKNIEWIQVIHHIYPDWKKRPGSKSTNFFGYYLQRFSFWLIKKKADRVIAVGRSTKRDLVRLGFDEQKVRVSSNGIDFAYFSDLAGGRFSCDGVFLARLSHSKGILDLIRIWKQVCRSIPYAKLAVIGGGDEKTKAMLKNEIKAGGLEENIKLLGFLPDSEAYPILKSGKVFVFPSHEEGWGIAVAEAIACELPVVSWNLPAYQNIFRDKIMQIEKGDTDLFSKKIVALLEDEAARKKIGKTGKEFIKNYSWEKVAEKEFEILLHK